MSGWCYRDQAGRVVGPMSGSALMKLAEYGEITSDTLVRKGAHGPWVPASRVKGLVFTPAPSPPRRKVDFHESNGTPIGAWGHVTWWVASAAAICIFALILAFVLVRRPDQVATVESSTSPATVSPEPVVPKPVEQVPEPQPVVPAEEPATANPENTESPKSNEKPEHGEKDQKPALPSTHQGILTTELVRAIEPSLVIVKTPTGRGSGFVVGRGLIATNFHVISGAKQATIQTINGAEYEVENCVAFSLGADLAVLAVKLPEDYAPLELQLEVPAKGERVLAFGCPQGFDFSVSEGIVSAIRQIRESQYIQTTSPISQGSSGGPLVEPNGKVIGVTVFKIVTGESLNFAVAAIHLHELLQQKPREPVPLAALPQIPVEPDDEPVAAEMPPAPAPGEIEAELAAIIATQRQQLADKLALVDQERILLFQQRSELNQKLTGLKQQASALAAEYRGLAQQANSVGVAATAVGNEAATIQQRLAFETDFGTRELLLARLQELSAQDAALTRQLALLNAQASQVQQAAAAVQSEVAAVTSELQSLYIRADQLRLEFLRILDPWGKAQLGDFEAAILALNEWIVREADHPDAYALRSFLNYWAGNREQGAADAATALRLAPKSWLSLAAAGYSDLQGGKTKAAIAKLNQSVTNAPWCAYAYFVRGIVHLQNRTFANAFADFKKAAELLPEEAAIHIQLAQMYAACPTDSRRNADKAMEHAQIALRSVGERKWAALDALAMALAESGDFMAAQQAVQQAIELAPSRMKPVYHSRLAAYMAGKPWRLLQE